MSTPSTRLVSRCTGRVFADKSFYASPLPYRPHFQQQRLASSSSSRKKANPVLEEYRRKQKAEEMEAAKAAPRSPTSDPFEALKPKDADIDQGSIFNDNTRAYTSELAKAAEDKKKATEAINPEIAAATLDPKPQARINFERRRVAQLVRRGGRISEKDLVKRKEREHLVRSHNMKTSVKKLGMLARQIAGKKLDEAIVQMRFSKKKPAQEILKQLEAARDEAIVMRGMGLGAVKSPKEQENEPENEQENEGDEIRENEVAGEEQNTSPSTAVNARAEGEEEEPSKEQPSAVFKPVDIQLKSGERYTVRDPTDIYIDQAWVGRGPYGKLVDHRARGRAFMLRIPSTSLSVVLKEDRTRIRLWEEREKKRLKQRSGAKVWQPLPDRPITNQRQWYNW